jgi:L-alanine-DL-glutamate epimerase-like enolase superfamily enzyme
MQREIELLASRGIGVFKIRARNDETAKAAWVLRHAGQHGIAVAIDMTQNLANPAQSVSDVLRFAEQVEALSSRSIQFLEEPLGPMDLDNWRLLRGRVRTRICGGETITTAAELCRRVRDGLYDFSQPDATVIGGLGQVMEVFATGRQCGVGTVVHCWGGAVGMMANYHAAFAGGGTMVEWPMPAFPIREAMLVEPLRFQGGRLLPPRAAGLGVKLTPQIEADFPFREDAVYRCLGQSVPFDPNVWQ